MPSAALRVLLVLTLVSCFLPVSTAVLTGYCTGQYVEKSDAWEDGIVQQGDVFELWCELPTNVTANEAFDLEVHFQQAYLVQRVLMPRAVYGTSVVVFP